MPVPPRKPRPSALQPSRKLKATCVLLHPGSQNPFLHSCQGCGGLRELPRLTHFTRSHAKSIQCLEEQAIDKENKSQLDFLSACQASLRASPVELCSLLVASYHILMGQALMSHPFSLSQEASSSKQVSSPRESFHILHLSIHLNLSSSIPLQTQWMSCLPVGPHPRQSWKEPPSSKWQ